MCFFFFFILSNTIARWKSVPCWAQTSPRSAYCDASVRERDRAHSVLGRTRVPRGPRHRRTWQPLCSGSSRARCLESLRLPAAIERMVPAARKDNPSRVKSHESQKSKTMVENQLHLQYQKGRPNSRHRRQQKSGMNVDEADGRSRREENGNRKKTTKMKQGSKRRGRRG